MGEETACSAMETFQFPLLICASHCSIFLLSLRRVVRKGLCFFFFAFVYREMEGIEDTF